MVKIRWFVKLDYALNLYEKCTTLVHVYKWDGLLGLRKKVDEHAEDLSGPEYCLLKYACDLITDGRDPNNIPFFLGEVYKGFVIKFPEDYESHRNLRLTQKFTSWIQLGDVDSHTVLLNALEDQELAGAYKNWKTIIEYDTSVTFVQSQTLSTEDWLKIRDSNEIVKTIMVSYIRASPVFKMS